jgi:hypothetical protein
MECDCGSGLTRRALNDGYGVFLCDICDACERDRLERYRDHLTEHTDEPIEPEG